MGAFLWMMSLSPEGILNIDKPLHLTSHDVVAQVRHLSHTRRVGHAGTLDPLATGVLLVCLGRTTRLIEYLAEQPKTYETTLCLGQETDTYDAEGTIVAARAVTITPLDVAAALPRFRGDIEQTPPMFSAIKKDGQPLYKLARRGIEVARPARPVTIYELTLLSCQLPLITLRVVCSTGTYIRSLAHDLGQALGCGGHVAALRRTAIGPFNVSQAIPLADLTPAGITTVLLPSDRTVRHLPLLVLSPLEVSHLHQGRRLPHQPRYPNAPLARVYDQAGTFLGIVAHVDDQWQPKKVFS